jgi:similar to stage IV sporulation protein
MESNYKLMCSGANLNNFINQCRNKNIEMLNVEKIERGITFEVSPVDYNLIKKIGCRGCVVQVISLGGIKNIRKKLISRMGLIVGFLLSVLLILFFNNRIMTIDINGLEYVSEEDVLKTLKSGGVKYMAKADVQMAYIEGLLAETYGFSVVSAIMRGNNIIINIKEELKNIEDEYVEIISDYNMIIKGIEVFAGTSNVDVGDIVRKSDVLVYPYIQQGDKKVFVKPSVKIVADVFYVDKFDLKNTEIKLVRTGKYVIADEKT